MLITDLAQRCGATAQGGDSTTFINSAADIMSATPHQVTVLSDGKYKKYLKDSKASACFIAEQLLDGEIPENLTLLVCKDPEISFLNAVKLLHPEPVFKRQVSEHAVLAETSTLGFDVHVGPFATVGQQSSIGDSSTIEAGARIGNHVMIGKHCHIHPNAVIYDHSIIGNNVIIHAGAVIGADGFGYKFRDNQHVKVPHVGHVEIADNVEIGANTCIDRGALGATKIGWGSKIDNLVQLGHNNIVGRNVIICGQSGISGSCTIEDGAILAGSTGVADHVKIGARAVVMARSGISGDIDPGAQVFGSPAKDRKVAWKELAALAKLPELLQKFKALEARVLKLEE
ncbi:UDP-3-O-(3-hydroxymyristoyl)glucosamine N-acyltransferase [Methylomonas sp. LW13]|uniref:UDP-3-O-acylglucosamine N-acyltransferase n=1 Tax=Methylomonas defluvii TaxID=3045149 RepID=A0ABU4UE09_9GAMM|nr:MULTISPECIES: UDP-3-O-(3-hydroxymyristoyl)glucosamine N-acyltransferase [unclassified Methylomonas]MDX8127378.1 UDP-3-O-(3-hydroxymyristoyl)glucosamine N-acyltransferase [Methylomonas sp. OY6]NOV30948.1 UDP-3-O-(3-hydroxymyristoyl)glucosamine N-acyltransferase [Methylomonas sp. ZR1]QBC26378.1 UDP-3-O-(3-hydroxymyristoyl)glucosamine N-acyltransferase [Methylomonas sp. LW13]